MLCSLCDHTTLPMALLAQEQEHPPLEYAEQLVLHPCRVCGRSFAIERLAKHESACAKIAAKPRQVFNTQGQRMSDDQVKAAQGTASGGGGAGGGRGSSVGGRSRGSTAAQAPDASSAATVPKWKRQSQDFQAMLKQGRRDKALLRQGVRASELPPPDYPQQEQHDDRVECPHCGRKFSQAAAERHVPHCKNMKARPTRLLRGGGAGGGKGLSR